MHVAKLLSKENTHSRTGACFARFLCENVKEHIFSERLFKAAGRRIFPLAARISNFYAEKILCLSKRTFCRFYVLSVCILLGVVADSIQTPSPVKSDAA